jgi:two-component system, LytTR family, sensor kinase
MYSWALLGVLVLWLARRFRIQKPFSFSFLAIHLFSSIFLSVVAVVIICTFGPWLRIPWYMPSFRTAFPATLAITGPVNVFTYWAIVMVAEASNGYRRYQEQKERVLHAELQLSEIKAQLANARLTALQNQLQPHFLFNTLNGIMVLVRRRDTAEAEEMLARLGDFLRSVLRDTDAQEVSLEKELEFLRLYLAIEKVRFQDRLQIEIDVKSDLLNAAVPNLCLQPLVENAIRHGVGRRQAGGKVTIRALKTNNNLTMEVRDDGGLSTPNSDKEGLGIGLANTRARLHNLYGDAGQVCFQKSEAGDTIAVLTMPYRLAARHSEDFQQV